jgi:hypothetical protein
LVLTLVASVITILPSSPTPVSFPYYLPKPQMRQCHSHVPIIQWGSNTTGLQSFLTGSHTSPP